jgi:hypothetical protein
VYFLNPSEELLNNLGRPDTVLFEFRYKVMRTYSMNVDTATQIWDIARFVPYPSNPRKNDNAVDRMAASIQEFGFKIRYWPAAAVRSWTAIFG